MRSTAPIPVWEIPIWKDISPRQRKVNEALKLINDTLDELIGICKVRCSYFTCKLCVSNLYVWFFVFRVSAILWLICCDILISINVVYYYCSKAKSRTNEIKKNAKDNLIAAELFISTQNETYKEKPTAVIITKFVQTII